MESELAQPANPLTDILGRLIHGEPIPRATIEQMAADAVSRLVGRKVSVDELKQRSSRLGVDIDGVNIELTLEELQARAGDLYSRASSRVRSPKDPEEARRRQEERERAKAERDAQRRQNAEQMQRSRQVSRARRILGFTAKEPVTRDQVKHRQRELARKHHPDRGGKLERMQEINWAVEILLAPA